MLSLLLLTPIIGSLFILAIQENTENSKNKMIILAITTSLINWLISIFFWVNFDSNTTQYQFVSEFDSITFGHLNLGMDGLSLYFVLLTTFITPIAIISNAYNINSNLKFFLISLLILETLQLALFLVLDLLLFYIFFESILPILFIIIIVYGSEDSKIRSANVSDSENSEIEDSKMRSAYLFFLYTLFGSLFMLLAILQIFNLTNTTDFQFLSLIEINLEYQKILWLAFFLAIIVKTPLWPFTGWLPRAHTDSPLAGSIFLAATILKFATYGYIRIILNFFPDATNYFGPLVQTIAIITLIYASLATIVQQDTKTLIAYSSIAHMSIVVLGLFSNSIQGIEGAILLALAHGFVSPALFICVGGIIYDRIGIRIIRTIRGLVTYMPIFTTLFFIFTLCNAGIPLSLNFLGEQLSLIGIWEINPIASVLGATGIVLSACYSIFLYNRISYGTYSPNMDNTIILDITRKEFFILISLLIPTILLGILPNIILNSIHLAVTTILYTI